MTSNLSAVDKSVLSALSHYYWDFPLDVTARQFCLTYCRHRLLNKGEISATIPAVLKNTQSLCFLSLYRQSRLLSCQLGHGANTLDALTQAIQETPTPNQPVTIALCFLFHEKKLTKVNECRLGIQALRIKKNNHDALFKNSVPIHFGWDLNTTLEKLCVKAGLPKQAYQDTTTDIFTYDTLEFSEDVDNKLCDFYRGNALILPSDVNASRLNHAIKIACRFLSNAILPSGEVHYWFLPHTHEGKTENSLASITRIIASLWQLALTSTNKDDINRAKKAVQLIVDRYFAYEKSLGFLRIDYQTHLGLNSFLLLFILTIHDEEFLSKEKNLLIFWMQSQLNDKKTAFLVSGDAEFLYPAQALLAFIALFKHTNDQQYLNIVESVFPYYEKIYRNDTRALLNCWFSKVCFELFLITKNKRYANYILNSCDQLLMYQIPEGYADLDMIGVFSQEGLSIPTASCAENLIHGYQIAKTQAESHRVEKYNSSIQKALRAILQCQLPSGGFKASIFNPASRIDHTQHALSAIYSFMKIIAKH